MPDTALDDLRIIELAEGVAGPYCGKLFADLGADVIKVEPPEGDRARRAGPFKGGEPNREGSGVFLYLNTIKRGVTADLASDKGREAVLALLAGADVLVTDMYEDAPAGRWASTTPTCASASRRSSSPRSHRSGEAGRMARTLATRSPSTTRAG